MNEAVYTVPTRTTPPRPRGRRRVDPARARRYLARTVTDPGPLVTTPTYANPWGDMAAVEEWQAQVAAYAQAQGIREVVMTVVPDPLNDTITLTWRPA